MYGLKELSTVEEEKHLVPNLSALAKALFPEEAYFISNAPHQQDWALKGFRIADGLVWLPWKAQLWLVEVEWKLRSNFDEQVRTFLDSRMDDKDEDRLRSVLKGQFEDIGIEDTLNGLGDYKEGTISRKIIDRTLKNHKTGQRFRPHLWVVLGHRGNRSDLKDAYLAPLNAWCQEDRQAFILSMARMFTGHGSSWILLDETCSRNCEQLPELEPSLLVPAQKGSPRASRDGLVPTPQRNPKSPAISDAVSETEEPSPAMADENSKASRRDEVRAAHGPPPLEEAQGPTNLGTRIFWALKHDLEENLSFPLDHTQVRIQLDEVPGVDFLPYWRSDEQLMLWDPGEGKPRKAKLVIQEKAADRTPDLQKVLKERGYLAVPRANFRKRYRLVAKEASRRYPKPKR